MPALGGVEPSTASDDLDRCGDVTQQREGDRHPELGHRWGHGPRFVDDDHSAAGGLVEVDPAQPIVERSRDHLESGCASEARRVEDREVEDVGPREPQRHDEGVGFGKGGV